jgi:hypothetical protein
MLGSLMGVRRVSKWANEFSARRRSSRFWRNSGVSVIILFFSTH